MWKLLLNIIFIAKVGLIASDAIVIVVWRRWDEFQGEPDALTSEREIVHEFTTNEPNVYMWNSWKCADNGFLYVYA